MTLPLDIESPALSTLPESAGPTPDGTVLGPSGTAGAVGTNTKTAGGTGEEPPVTPTAPVLSFIAHGTPKPKGSMRHVGKGVMVEQVNGKPWREAVKWAALQAKPDAPGAEIWSDKVGGVCHRGFPLEGPLRVEAAFTFVKPSSAPKRRRSWPVTRSTGDADKQLRNLFDAMVDAGVMRDDSQIVEATVAKRYPLEGRDALTFPGVVVRIYRIGEDT